MRTSPLLRRVPLNLVVVLTVVLTSAPSIVLAQGRTLEIDDLRLEVGVSTPVLSPDGSQAIVTTSTPNYEDNRFDRTLVLVDVATGAQRELTPHRPGVRQPRWSPTGDRLAFTDSSEDDEDRQVFMLPMGGGEARQVTHAEEGIKGFEWTMDGAHILYTSPDVAVELEGEERHNKSFEVGDNSYLTLAAPRSAHLWRVSVEGGDAERLTEGAESIDGFVVSSDGHTVALEVLPLPHSGEGIRSTIRLIDLESGETRDLVGDRPVSPWKFSPDGRYLAFGRSRGPEPGFNPNGIFLKPVDGAETIDVTAQIDRSLRGMAWMPDGQSILVSGTDLTARALWHQPLDGAPQRLDLGDIHPGSPVVAPNGTVVFVGREDHRASELYAMSAGQWEPRRLTSFNDALAEMHLGHVETVIWSGPDGFEQNGVLVYPPEYEAGRRYPLVLSIHGGPMGASVEAFSTFNQIMAARGWLVFSPNYRGSSTQGKAFQSAVINDAGEGPGRDVMSGVQVLKERGIVDESRVAVSGWSYGGYMTAWLTAHYDGWAVAMAGAAVTDWFDWYSMADMNTWAGYGLGGSPWLNDNAMNYWRQSPMAYAHQIRTPTLILSDTGDERVTVSQSYKLYHALKDNGVEVKFVVYPVPGHFPADPVHRRDLRRRWVEWIAQHFDRIAATSE
ncbi:MAG: S9 family peptidase [Acidobacteria bacterium]|nr:MAG: S9 family peptidase [Acidobacteriota bacterium]